MDPLRHFGFLLKDVARLSSKNFERRAIDEALGLTLEQCRVLVYLERCQGITQTRLAYLTETDPMTLVRILDRMEQSGWLERRLDPNDRRVRRLHLKPAARSTLKRIWAIAGEARAEALAGFSADETELLLTLLDRVHGNLAELVPNAVGFEHRHAEITALTPATAESPVPTPVQSPTPDAAQTPAKAGTRSRRKT